MLFTSVMIEAFPALKLECSVIVIVNAVVYFLNFQIHVVAYSEILLLMQKLFQKLLQ